MAALSDADREAVWAEYMEQLCSDREPLLLAKADLLAAVNSLDQFLSDNAATINNAIPQTARTALTTTQKARLLVFIVRQRWIKGA